MTIGKFLLFFVYAYIACLAFSFIFNLRGKFIALAPLGGSISWIVYNLMSFSGADLLQYFIATMAVSIYSEILARKYKAPVTMFLIIGLLPLVPGAGIYYTMEYCVAGNQIQFYSSLVHTLAIAGSLALGIVLVSSLFRIYFQLKMRYLEKRDSLKK